MSAKPAIHTPAVLVVFGATGDLFKKKIVPATYLLKQEHRLPEQFAVVGYGRKPLTNEDFRARVLEVLLKGGASEEDAQAFAESFSYVVGEFDDAAAFGKLKEHLEALDATWGTTSAKAFYLAVPPELFGNLFSKLAGAGLTENGNRILVEKPFGSNLKEAQELNTDVRTFFDESAVYRIEHYLTKDTLRLLPSLRKENTMLEQLLSPLSIERIHVELLETLGVEDRGPFYEKIGAWRDVGENHLVQMLTLTLMDLPATDTAEDLRAKRAAFMKSLPLLTDEDITSGAVRAQYEGYRSITGVAPDSMTETYFKLPLVLTGPYAGIPVTLESGKRFVPARKRVEVTLKPGAAAKRISIELEPEMKISIFHNDTREEKVFANAAAVKTQYAGQYADILVNAFCGDHRWFVSAEEVEAEWRFADPVTNAFQKNVIPLQFYTPDQEKFLER